jgi:hypothetical protein
MKASTPDNAYSFEIVPKNHKFAGTVKSHISGAYDTTGKDPDSGHEWIFDSMAEAMAWAASHSTSISVPGELFWE